jgi:hypothetical protein
MPCKEYSADAFVDCCKKSILSNLVPNVTCSIAIFEQVSIS